MIALDVLLDTLPTALVDDAAYKRLRLVGDQLPDALTGRIGLEARLHDDPQVDLLLLANTERQLGVLAGTDPAVRLAEEIRAQAAWRGAARLARRSLRLLANASPLPPAIWLEFDADPARSGLPVPGVFTAAAPDPGTPQARDWQVCTTIDEILATAEGVAPGATARGLSEQIRRVAGSEFTIRQVGFFPGRPSLAVRLFCALDGPERLVPALAACGWRGPAAVLGYWNELCAEYSDSLHIGIDVSVAGVLPGVGIEVSLAGTPQPADDRRWAGLLEALREAGMCTPAKRDAVCALGRTYTAQLLTPRRYRQGLHHLKVSVAADATTTAKAYFGAYEA